MNLMLLLYASYFIYSQSLDGHKGSIVRAHNLGDDLDDTSGARYAAVDVRESHSAALLLRQRRRGPHGTRVLELQRDVRLRQT